jgi:hypothetical protein
MTIDSALIREEMKTREKMRRMKRTTMKKSMMKKRQITMITLINEATKGLTTIGFNLT